MFVFVTPYGSPLVPPKSPASRATVVFPTGLLRKSPSIICLRVEPMFIPRSFNSPKSTDFQSYELTCSAAFARWLISRLSAVATYSPRAYELETVPLEPRGAEVYGLYTVPILLVSTSPTRAASDDA